MKKRLFSLFAIFLLGIGLIGCNKNTQNHIEETTSHHHSSQVHSHTEDHEIPKESERENLPIISKKTVYLEKLDDIQKKLDELPIKADADQGVTNAMKSFYAISYEKYDEVLNEIYRGLKEELPEETMKKLQAEQIQWIKEKEYESEKEKEPYRGGTFEYVAYYISLYDSTKSRCYELVNQYME